MIGQRGTKLNNHFLPLKIPQLHHLTGSRRSLAYLEGHEKGLVMCKHVLMHLAYGFHWINGFNTLFGIRTLYVNALVLLMYVSVL